MNETTEILTDEDTFHFSCNPLIDCFTQCCRDVNIFLTPYDILQMKNRLGISSSEFLRTYTKTVIAPETMLPAVQFSMDETNDKRCYFVDAKGCGIYDSRPWSCRMYPLDSNAEGSGFYPIVDSSRCLGLKDDTAWVVKDWLQSQGLRPYDQWNRRFAEVTEDAKLTTWRKKDPNAVDIFYLACYDLDRFREHMLNHGLYSMVDDAASDLEKIKADDFALLEFAFTWLRTVAKRAVDGGNDPTDGESQ